MPQAKECELLLGLFVLGRSELWGLNQARSLGPKGRQRETLGFGRAPRAVLGTRESLWLQEKGGELVPSSLQGRSD